MYDTGYKYSYLRVIQFDGLTYLIYKMRHQWFRNVDINSLDTVN